MFQFIKRIILGYKSSSDDYICFLRNKGVTVGENVIIYRPFNTNIDTQNPHLLNIGNDVMMTGPVTILTHDYSWSVLKKKYGVVCGKQRKTVIGNNVFIGWGATILPGANIGDNVIIGANAVVSGRVESDSVYAGNPAKKVMSLDAFYARRRDSQLKEAVAYVSEYKARFGEEPPVEELDEYFYLFFNSDNLANLPPQFVKKLKLMNNEAECFNYIKNHQSMFLYYASFLEYCQDSET